MAAGKYDYEAAIDSLNRFIQGLAAARHQAAPVTAWGRAGQAWRAHWASAAALLVVYTTTTTAVVSAYFAEEQRKARGSSARWA